MTIIPKHKSTLKSFFKLLKENFEIEMFSKDGKELFRIGKYTKLKDVFITAISEKETKTKIKIKSKVKYNNPLYEFIPCVYLMHSKKLNLFKIGQTSNIYKRLYQIKNEAHPSDDWEVLETFQESNKRLLESLLHLRFRDNHHSRIDYFTFSDKNKIRKSFREQCEECIKLFLIKA